MSQLSSTSDEVNNSKLSRFASQYYNALMQENCELLKSTGLTSEALDKVYHSESRHEMEVNADLQGVDLTNPHVLLYLAKQTAYHHAFWPHTAKRFLAFKNILRYNKQVRASLKDGQLLSMINIHFDAIVAWYCDDPIYDTPGHRQEMDNLKQVISIVEKARETA